jgi:hypothetical protein
MSRILVILVLFGVVVGYVEAATVVYIRIMYEPMHRRVFPDRAPDDLFPAFSFEQWAREAPAYVQSPVMEVVREIGTVLGLALVGLLVAPTLRRWSATVFLLLGVTGWSFYLSLKALMGWPHSLSDWDVIFLVPLPWVGPVWAALAAYTAMTAAAGWFFWSEAAGRPLRAGPVGWLFLLAGSLVMAVPFCWDYQHIAAGGYPRPFNAGLLAAGLLLVLTGLIIAWRRGAKMGPREKPLPVEGNVATAPPR